MPSPAAAQTPQIPSAPIGWLTVFPTVVQTGTKPKLTWCITYPNKVSDAAAIIAPGRIVLTQQMYVSVQIVGTGPQPSGATGTAPTSPPPTEARLSIDGGAYQQLFYGTQAEVNPFMPLYEKRLDVGQTIDFGGRYVENAAWTPFYTTNSKNMQVVALVTGDEPPTTFPLYQQPSLASYLKPYLDASGLVNIGPLSVLILMELTDTNHGHPTYDYSDQVLLVTFNKKHSNNGHGNNLDGVDVSNPGQGHGGPNGEIDPSGGVDDEKR
jgi:hypothetical protein